MPTTVTEKSILFSTELVQAILEGRKTQTRRVIKPQPHIQHAHDGFKFLYQPGKGPLWANDDEGRCPYGSPGDELYVRETWKPYSWSEDGTEWRLEYKAGGFADVGPLYEEESDLLDFWMRLSEDLIEKGCPQEDQMFKEPHRFISWKPSIHLPRPGSRIQLQITNVRVERLQVITEEDAQAEGCENDVEIYEIPEGRFKGHKDYKGYYARERFRELWDEINFERGYGWANNPWVWVLDFNLLTVKK